MLHYDETTRQAAGLLLNKIHNFGPSIARQNYPTETTSINGIIDSFNTEPKLKEALKLLKLAEWTKKLDSQNKLFSKRYIDRIDESAKQSDDKIKELRSTTTENFIHGNPSSDFSFYSVKFCFLINLQFCDFWSTVHNNLIANVCRVNMLSVVTGRILRNVEADCIITHFYLKYHSIFLPVKLNY